MMRARVIRRTAAQYLRRVDRWLGARFIPVEYFGWQKLGETETGVGGPIVFGKWNSTPAHREPFYRHNRELDHLRGRVRKLAILIDAE